MARRAQHFRTPAGLTKCWTDLPHDGGMYESSTVVRIAAQKDQSQVEVFVIVILSRC